MCQSNRLHLTESVISTCTRQSWGLLTLQQWRTDYNDPNCAVQPHCPFKLSAFFHPIYRSCPISSWVRCPNQHKLLAWSRLLKQWRYLKSRGQTGKFSFCLYRNSTFPRGFFSNLVWLGKCPSCFWYYSQLKGMCTQAPKTTKLLFNHTICRTRIFFSPNIIVCTTEHRCISS